MNVQFTHFCANESEKLTLLFSMYNQFLQQKHMKLCLCFQPCLP